MSTQMSIEPPTHLFTLPHLLNPNADHIRSGRAFSIRRSRRRRCAQIPFAIDGQSISVYDAKTGNLVSAFPVAPQTSFTSDPVLVYVHNKRGQMPLSYSYVAYKNGTRGGPARIKCFQLDSSDARSGDKNVVKVTECDINSYTGSVVSIEPLPDSDTNQHAHTVLISFENGDIACYSPDLLEEHWRSNIQSIAPNLGNTSDVILEHTRTNPTFPLVQRGWLHRIAGERLPVDSANSNQGYLRLAGVITKCTFNEPSGVCVRRQAHILVINDNNKSNLASRSTVHYIRSYHLPDIASSSPPSISYVFDFKAGLLHQTISTRHMCLEFGPSALSKRSDFFSPSEKLSTSLPLLGTFIIMMDSERCAIYDTRHNSLLASTKITKEVNEFGKKRKRDGANWSEGHTVLVDFFESTMTAIAVSESQALTVRIGMASDTTAKRRKTSLLSSSLGRGSILADNTRGDISNFARSLKASLRERNAVQFEKLFLESLSSADAAELQEKIALYTTAQLFKNAAGFELRSQDYTIDEFPVFSMKVFDWLLNNNYVSETRINQSVRLFSKLSLAVTTIDLVSYLVAMDPSLDILTKFIAHTVPVALAPLLRSIVSILRSFHPTNHEIDSMDPEGSQSADEALALAERAADQDISTAVSLLADGSSVSRGYALKLCVNQLAVSYNPQEITQAMRIEMTNRDLAMLIELLRTEISGAGWGSHCLDVYPAQPDAVDSQNEALAAICRLLDCSLDALGTGGWLGALQTTNPSMLSSVDEEADHRRDLITSLRLETSTALETVQESTFLHGFLRDFFRFDRTYQESVAQAESRGDWAKYPKLYELATARNPSLPVGLEAIKPVESTRIAAGGEIKQRTRRDMSQKLNKTMNKYTFEKIVI